MKILPESLYLPQKTVSRKGAALELPLLARQFGRRGLLAHGNSLQSSGTLDRILSAASDDMSVRAWRHSGGEPSVDAVDALRAALKADPPDWVAAVGGGSVIDLAKAAAGLADAPEKTAYYQRHQKEVTASEIPLVAAPSTAGTGSEATPVSVLTDPERVLKQSIRHNSHIPRLVILDPDLLIGCPPATVAAAGLDAFVQAFESYTSRHATPFTRNLSELALQRIANSLLPLYLQEQEAASEMLEASYLAGIALCHARLGVVHGLAHPLGARFNVAHGLACACCLPAALAFNRPAIQPDLHDLKNRLGIDVEALVAQWLGAMRLDNPFKGRRIADQKEVIRETLASGSTAANPRPVSAADAQSLLETIFC
ncbi:MAG: iron-containing alcohol dehydrogenase [Kiritimatiellae bacterium]|nr:iron-containing alcohol dehydrogenase [Kiritimatiellia bacterium]